MANFSLIKIPGRSKLRIPVVNTAAQGAHSDSDSDAINFTSSKSPEWMIQIDNFLSSTVSGYENYAELFGWYGESSRYTSGNVSSQLFTSATLQHTDLVIIIPNGGYATTLESLMNTGTSINQVTITRLGKINSMVVTLQTLVYTTCRIQRFNQQLDQLVVEMSILAKSNTVYVYGQDGQSQGQMVSSVDYSQNVAQ
ncbi:MAG: hypothetical protein Q8S21_00125 [Candidatus Paracaedibacteraceae bacterium]|nr:hypothetical protein [Candidatus Paracaedibacteraceae bacterium]